MSDSNMQPHARVVQHAHRRLQLLVREVGVLCRRRMADENFYPAYLQRIAAALAAEGASIWLADTQGELQIRWQAVAPQNGEAQPAVESRRHWVQRALVSRDGVAFRGGVYVPLRRDGQTFAVIEVLKPATSDLAAARRWLRFVQHMAMLAAERPRHASQGTAADDAVSPSRALAAVRAIHDSLGLDETSYAIVNELRRYGECDRVSLVLLRRGRPRLQAISGQDSFNRRAAAVRQLESLAAHCMRAIDAQWFERHRSATDSTPAAFPAGAEELSPWKALGIVPLHAGHANEPLALLIVEHAAGDTAPLKQRVGVLLPHVQRALASALQHSSVPWASLWASCGRWLKGGAASWKRRSLLLLAATAAITFLATFPVRFQVYGRGTLQPSVQRDVFADVAGVVRHVRVEHGDFVQAGDVLAELHNSDLEVAIAELQGQQRAAREQLAAAQRQRHDPRTPRVDHDRLASETLQLQEQLVSLGEQLALQNAQRERLVVRSPIAGQIVTWNIKRQLNERPVAVGQVLMTVADPSSPWQLEVFLPEADIGHLATPAAQNEPPIVEYVAVTEPTRGHRGMLRQIDARAELHEEHDHSVRAVVDIERSDVPQAPVGTSVTARIDCGQRPIGYVWLHRLLGFVYTNILFRVM